MTGTRRHHLSAYRRRLKQRGVVRVEVSVRKKDASLVRGIVKALGDPEREMETRALLRQHFDAVKAKGVKDWLAAAPLEGIDLARERHVGRDIDL
jgi:hypothetical protein